MPVVDDLKAQIDAGAITFDTPATKSAQLRQELLGENSGTKVTGRLQSLVLALSRLQKIRISSLIRSEGHHGSGRAVDVGNHDIALNLLPAVTDRAKIAELNIDEVIFDAAIAGKANRNEWNHDRGKPHPYKAETLDEHQDHIHFAVTE